MSTESPFSNFLLSTTLLPSASTHIEITCHSKIKQISHVPHPPPDATPAPCSSHNNTHLKSCLYSSSTPSLLVFLGAPLIRMSSPFLHREVIHDLHVVNSNGAFSVLIMCSQKGLTEQTANSQTLPSLNYFIAFDIVFDYQLFTLTFLKYFLQLPSWTTLSWFSSYCSGCSSPVSSMGSFPCLDLK